MKKPIIAITLDYINDGDSAKYSDFSWYALRQQYSSMILKSGGLPIMLPFESYKDDLLIVREMIDGLLIPGGDLDVPPAMYNEEILFDTNPCVERSNNESLIILEALERNIPILGICHGMQLLNVLLGGNLYQNITEQIPNSINHKQTMSRSHTYHSVKVEQDTLLYNLLGNSREFSVNSHHRQSVKRLGKGLISCAISEDSVVEAIESQDHDFVLGIEWHPEIEASKEQDNAIFSGFIEAAKKYGKTSKGY